MRDKHIPSACHLSGTWTKHALLTQPKLVCAWQRRTARPMESKLTDPDSFSELSINQYGGPIILDQCIFHHRGNQNRYLTSQQIFLYRFSSIWHQWLHLCSGAQNTFSFQYPCLFSEVLESSTLWFDIILLFLIKIHLNLIYSKAQCRHFQLQKGSLSAQIWSIAHCREYGSILMSCFKA